MWLITPTGFYSIVEKPEDKAGNTLTVRARIRADLESLREHFLPGMGEITESKSTDYRFRAVAPRAEVASAMAKLIEGLSYSNFKNEVAKQQGYTRAHLYHDVWDVLYRLQAKPEKYAVVPPAAKSAAPTMHPREDENGNPVVIKKPSQPSGMNAWSDPAAIACVVPDGPMPAAINGLSVQPWTQVPATKAAWEALAAKENLPEPEFKVPAGYKKAAGAVIREPDGRIWIVAPTNGFAGYQATFPKGTMNGLSAQAAALVEVWEESGLQVRLTKHLVDVKRSQSYTRYYLAERVGGNPADMGWESQAVMLLPANKLTEVLNSPNDLPIVDALSKAE